MVNHFSIIVEWLTIFFQSQNFLGNLFFRFLRLLSCWNRFQIVFFHGLEKEISSNFEIIPKSVLKPLFNQQFLYFIPVPNVLGALFSTLFSTNFILESCSTSHLNHFFATTPKPFEIIFLNNFEFLPGLSWLERRNVNPFCWQISWKIFFKKLAWRLAACAPKAATWLTSLNGRQRVCGSSSEALPKWKKWADRKCLNR